MLNKILTKSHNFTISFIRACIDDVHISFWFNYACYYVILIYSIAVIWPSKMMCPKTHEGKLPKALLT